MPKMIFSFLLAFIVVLSIYQVIINTPKEFLIKFLKGAIPVIAIGTFVLVGFIVFVNLF